MKPIRICGPATALALLLLGAGGPAQALNPPIRMAQGIEYMCGGSSGDEAAFMRRVSPRWAAALEFSVHGTTDPGMPWDVKVEVRERYTGRPVMQAVSGAPMMLARLAPGAYEVRATLAGVTLEQPLIVFNGSSSRAAFVWPSNVDFAAAAGLPAVERQAVATMR